MKPYVRKSICDSLLKGRWWKVLLEEIFLIFDFSTGNSVNFGVIKAANLIQTIWGAEMAENGKAAGASSHIPPAWFTALRSALLDFRL